MGWNEENIKKMCEGTKTDVSYCVMRHLTVEDVDDIMTTAIEGGIGYWCVLDNTTESWLKAEAQLKEKGIELYWGTVATKVLLNGDEICMYDAEADEEDLQEDEIWNLDLQGFVRGCKIYEQERGSLTKNLEDGNFDAVEADCLIQYALFGEIVFG